MYRLEAIQLGALLCVHGTPPSPKVCKVRINKDLGLDFHFDGQLAESHQWVAGRNLDLYLQYIMPYKSLNG